MTAAYTSNGTTQSVALHMAFELSWTSWKLAFTTGHGQQPRQRTIKARDLAALECHSWQEPFRSRKSADSVLFLASPRIIPLFASIDSPVSLPNQPKTSQNPLKNRKTLEPARNRQHCGNGIAHHRPPHELLSGPFPLIHHEKFSSTKSAKPCISQA